MHVNHWTQVATNQILARLQTQKWMRLTGAIAAENWGFNLGVGDLKS